MSQQPAFEYIRHGQIPFFRVRTADFTRAGADCYRDVDAVLLGVPFDGGTTYQSGARFGPYHVRRTSALVQGFHPTHRVDIFETLNVIDGGNVVAPPFNAGAVRELIQVEIKSVLDAGAVPFLVGGDHSITLPALRALAAQYGPVAVLHIDAHFDTSGPEVWGESFHHGTPIRHALLDGLIERGQLHQVGMRVTWKDASERQLVDEYGAHVYSMDQIDEAGGTAIGKRILHDVGNRPLYISFDIDGIDPAFAPGTGTPVPGGMTSREALSLMRGLAGARICGMDLVEVSPNLDHADMTCHLASHLLFEGLALLARSAR